MPNLWTPEDSHFLKYEKLVSALHIKVEDGFLGRSRAQWMKLLKEDEHLNNVPLSEWDDKATGFLLHHKANPCRPGWNLSMSEMVCAFKHAVRCQIVEKVCKNCGTLIDERGMCGGSED